MHANIRKFADARHYKIGNFELCITCIFIVFTFLPIGIRAQPNHEKEDRGGILGKLSRRLSSTRSKRYESSQELAEVGDRCFNEKDYDEALYYYNEAIRKNSLASYYRSIAKCHIEKGEFLTALHNYQKAASLPKHDKSKETLDPIDLVNLGDELFDQSLFEEALWCYIAAAKLRPIELLYYKLIMKCHIKLKSLTNAISDLRKTLLVADKFGAQGVSFEDELGIFGKRSYMDAEFITAFWCFDELIKRYTVKMSYFALRGNCYLQMKNFKMAISDYKTELKMYPHNMSAWYNLIGALFRLGEFDEAIEETRGILSDVELAQLGKDFFFHRKPEFAIRLYTEAINRNPDNASHYRLRGECFWEMKVTDMAISDFEQILRISPQNENDRIFLGKMLFDAERYSEAIKEILDMNDTYLVNLGNKFLRGDKLEEAILCYTHAIDKNSENEESYAKRGLCSWRKNDLKAAISDFEAVLQIVPANVPTLVDLCDVLIQAKEYDKAKIILEKIDEIRSHLTGAQLARVANGRAEIIKYEEGMMIQDHQ